MAQLISSFNLLACPLDQLPPRLWNTKNLVRRNLYVITHREAYYHKLLNFMKGNNDSLPDRESGLT